MATAQENFLHRLTVYIQNAIFTDDSFVDLAGLFAEVPPPTQRDQIEMIRRAKEFPDIQFMEQICRNIFKQNLSLRRRTWTKLITFQEAKRQTGGFSGRSGVAQTGQIGMEVLFVLSNVSASEIFQRLHRRTFDPNSPEDCLSRNDFFDDNIIDGVVSQLKIEEFYFTSLTSCSNKVLVDRIREFVASPVLQHVISTVYNRLIKPTIEMTTDDVTTTLQGMKIYVCAELGTVRGCTLRDGILICEEQVNKTHGNNIFDADLFCLVLHECTHFCARWTNNDYGFALPISLTNDPDGTHERLDVQTKYAVNGKLLELGRAAEAYLIGDDGGQIDWPKTSVNAAVDFMKKVRENRMEPFYKNQDERMRIGLQEAPACLSLSGCNLAWPKLRVM